MKKLTKAQRITVRDALTRAITLYGSQKELAVRMKITLPYVNKMWLTGHVPVEQLKNFEQATNGAVNRTELRPDLYE